MSRKGAADWGPIYMLVVVIIGAVLVMTLLKPALKQAGGAADDNLKEARQIASVQYIAPSFEQLSIQQFSFSPDFPLILSKFKKST